jgi:hypothetical protein
LEANMRIQNIATTVLSLVCAMLMVLVYGLTNMVISNRAEIGLLRYKNVELEAVVKAKVNALNKARAKSVMKAELAQNRLSDMPVLE